MAWIELHDTLPDHPKTLATSEALKIDKDLLVGKLCRLWTWCLNQRENGMIADYEIGTVAEVMRWSKKPAILISALCVVPTGYEHGFLERVDGGYVIHDWDERVEMLMEKREEKRSKTRGRVQKHRAKKKANSDSCNAATEESQRDCNAENAECNALQERYVTGDVTQSNAATVPKPYLNLNRTKHNQCVSASHSPRARENTHTQPHPESDTWEAPTAEQVAEYCQEAGVRIDAQRFVDYYGAVGWKAQNGLPITDWRAKARAWVKTERGSPTEPAQVDPNANPFN